MSVDHSAGFVKPQNTTSDAFLAGRLTLFQPRAGFRAGTDSVLLGAAVSPASGSIADLGAGAGTAGLVAAVHNPDAGLVLVEHSPEMAQIAASNIAANGMARRGNLLVADVAAQGAEREAAGLVPDSFDSVIANPPFFAQGKGTRAPNGSRAGARHMPEGAIENWVRTAAAIAAPRGEAVFIYPAAGLPELIAAFARRFGAMTLLPIAGRPGEPASRILLRGIKGSRAPLTILPPLVLHAETGNGFVPAVAAILSGESRLIW